MRQRTLVSGILFICSILATNTAFAFPSFTWIVGDSSQPSTKNVGYVISVSNEAVPGFPRRVGVILPIPKVPEPPTGPDWWKIGLRVTSEEIPFQGFLWFTNTDCTGTPWIGENHINAEFDPGFDPHVVIGDNLDFEIRTLYMADPGTSLSAPMDFKSSLFGDGGCFAVATSQRAKPAILLDADLHQTYPPPYNLYFEVSP